MAQLTPLAKGLIGVIVLAAGVAVAWNVVKHTDGAAVAGTPSSITTAGTPANPYPGEILRPTTWKLEDIPDDAAIICRNNAPLFSLAIALLKTRRYRHPILIRCGG